MTRPRDDWVRCNRTQPGDALSQAHYGIGKSFQHTEIGLGA